MPLPPAPTKRADQLSAKAYEAVAKGPKRATRKDDDSPPKPVTRPAPALLQPVEARSTKAKPELVPGVFAYIKALADGVRGVRKA